MTSAASLPALFPMHSDDLSTPGEPQQPRRPGRRRAATRDVAFPNNLKRLRAVHNLTQKELDAALGISAGTTTQWEQGTKLPKPDELRSIAAYFKITVDQLLDPEANLAQSAPTTDPLIGAWQRLIRDVLAYYPGHIEIKEINFFAPHSTANLAPGASPDRPAV